MTPCRARVALILAFLFFCWTSPVLAAIPEAPLIGTHWTLVSVGGAPAERDRREPHLVFGPAGALSGNTGCNNLRAVYTLDNDRLSFSPIMTTRMYCRKVAETEQGLLMALRDVTGWEIEGNDLRLIGSAGATLAVFTTVA
ncbi:MAG: META domain-containing protein [Hyphomicrobiales bacterium]|nr:META domain-containing protein [Hyphomicrobiales bacterium]